MEKDKFRFINIEEVVYALDRHRHDKLRGSTTEFEEPNEDVTVVKVTIEIIDDQAST